MNDTIDPSLAKHIKERLLDYVPHELSEAVTQYLEKPDTSVLDFTDFETGKFLSHDKLKELLKSKGMTDFQTHKQTSETPDTIKNSSDESLQVVKSIKEDMKKLGDQIDAIEQTVQNQQL